MDNNWNEEYIAWQHMVEKSPTPLPPDIDLDTLSGLGQWLSHPSNWMNTDLYVIKWNGLIPSISRFHAWKLAPGCPERTGLLGVLLYERKYRRLRPNQKDDNSQGCLGE